MAVGTSGNAGIRLSVLTANATSLPVLEMGRADHQADREQLNLIGEEWQASPAASRETERG